MTKILIKSVIPFAKYENVIYSYKIKGLLSNGEEISILDEVPINVEGYINQYVQLELSSYFISEKGKDANYCFVGKVKYHQEINQYYFENEFIKILLPIDCVKNSDIKINKTGKYCFEELVLKQILL
ncbi:MAG: hypothetical protein Q4C98_11665 [Capnocytophaga sp.]|nr:hypothetical protein [Capnocytophaga sp.]